MNVVAVDCSTDVLAVAAARGTGGPASTPSLPKHPYRDDGGHGHAPGPGFATVSIDAGFRHAERLMGAIEYCVSEAGFDRSNLDLLVCAGGPGSFTGLRIGMATVKGLALGLGKPFVAVPTLDAWAAAWEGASPVVVPVMDAKRARFYFGLYRSGGPVQGPFDDGLARILELTSGCPEVLFVGPDADMLENIVSERAGFRFVDGRRSVPVGKLLDLGLARYLGRGADDPDADLLYLRASDAEENAAAGRSA